MTDSVEPPECMAELVDRVRERFEYVITILRSAEDSLDNHDGKKAFAFIIGSDSDNALVIEGSVTGDGKQATATIWGITDGARATINTMEMDEQWLLSIPLSKE